MASNVLLPDVVICSKEVCEFEALAIALLKQESKGGIQILSEKNMDWKIEKKTVVAFPDIERAMIATLQKQGGSVYWYRDENADINYKWRDECEWIQEICHITPNERFAKLLHAFHSAYARKYQAYWIDHAIAITTNSCAPGETPLEKIEFMLNSDKTYEDLALLIKTRLNEHAYKNLGRRSVDYVTLDRVGESRLLVCQLMPLEWES